MDKLLEQFVSNIKDEAGTLARSEILEFLRWNAAEADEFTKQLKQDVDRYMLQLAAGQITKRDLEMYLRSHQRQAEAHLLVAGVVRKAMTQRLVNGIKDLLIGNLLKFL